ncbi:MAG: sigma-54 dependent transcriptional regulator [Deltaproteobacteria bacterium]|nr:sigma-54 dependent transcriptional regulator [Deltaproteobacteria bacterium]
MRKARSTDSLIRLMSTAPQDPSNHKPFHLLVVDDDADMRDLLREELEDEGYLVEVAAGGRTAVERIRQGGIDLMVSDVRMPDLDGLDLLKELRAMEVAQRPHVITITAFGSIDTAIRAVKLGAFDYITKPFEMRELLVTIEKALQERSTRDVAAPEIAEAGAGAVVESAAPRTEQLGTLFGRSSALRELFALVRRLEQSSANVLITGEPGTGKETLARAVHQHSPRASQTFVAARCSTMTPEALEQALFDGTGGNPGLFEQAAGGTLFMDEVADLPTSLYTRVLGVLQDRQPHDVRVIAGTNRDLEAELKAGRFRDDLYYRLAVVQMNIPPLRERVDDVLPLAQHFLARSANRASKPARGLDEEVRKLLCAYSFPGNVRELENLVERAVALSNGPMITIGDLPASLRDRRNQDRLADALSQGLTLGELERAYIERVLDAEGGNKTRAALRLGVDRRTLYRKLEEWEAEKGIAPPAPKGDRLP